MISRLIRALLCIAAIAAIYFVIARYDTLSSLLPEEYSSIERIVRGGSATRTRTTPPTAPATPQLIEADSLSRVDSTDVAAEPMVQEATINE